MRVAQGAIAAVVLAVWLSANGAIGGPPSKAEVFGRDITGARRDAEGIDVIFCSGDLKHKGRLVECSYGRITGHRIIKYISNDNRMQLKGIAPLCVFPHIKRPPEFDGRNIFSANVNYFLIRKDVAPTPLVLFYRAEACEHILFGRQVRPDRGSQDFQFNPSADSRRSPGVFERETEPDATQFALPSHRRVNSDIYGHPWTLISDVGISRHIVGVGSRFRSDPLEIERVPHQENASARYDYAHNPYKKRDVERPLSPYRHLLLGIQILLGALGFAGGIYGAIKAVSDFFDGGKTDAFVAKALLCIGISTGSGIFAVNLIVN